MSGAASSSMTAGLNCVPQNSLNQRPTIALLSSTDMRGPPLDASGCPGLRVPSPRRRRAGRPRKVAGDDLTSRYAAASAWYGVYDGTETTLAAGGPAHHAVYVPGGRDDRERR